MSVIAHDLAESIAFYEHALGLERVPTPNFGFPVQWLRAGSLQVHLFERPGEAPSHAHFALEVDDPLAVYARARELGVLDHDTFGNCMYELPDGAVQIYIRDPAGNLVELDHPDASSVRGVPEFRVLGEVLPQEGDAAAATLFLGRG